MSRREEIIAIIDPGIARSEEELNGPLFRPTEYFRLLGQTSEIRRRQAGDKADKIMAFLPKIMASPPEVNPVVEIEAAPVLAPLGDQG